MWFYQQGDQGDHQSTIVSCLLLESCHHPKVRWVEVEVESELPKVLIKVLFWALCEVLLLGKVLFKVLKKVLKIV